MSTPIVNTPANKAVYGGAVPAVLYLAEATIEWAWPSTATLLTDGFIAAANIALVAAVAYFVPNADAPGEITLRTDK